MFGIRYPVSGVRYGNPPRRHRPAGADPHLDAAKRWAKDPANQLGKRDSEQDARPGSRDAGQKVAQPHARIDHHGNRARLEQREYGGDQRQALADHDECPVPGTHAAVGEMRAPGGDLRVEFSEGQRQVVDLAGVRACARDLHRGATRLARGH